MIIKTTEYGDVSTPAYSPVATPVTRKGFVILDSLRAGMTYDAARRDVENSRMLDAFITDATLAAPLSAIKPGAPPLPVGTPMLFPREWLPV